MKKVTFIITLLIIQTINSQSQNLKFGIKSGINLSKYTPEISIDNIKLADYQNKFGFYLGMYANISISKKIKFQPELLFSTQGTKILIENISLTDATGISIDNGNIESKINESTILLPLNILYSINDKFSIEVGPQLGYIINRKEEITENILVQDIGIINEDIDYDKFDFGFNLGIGFKIVESIKLNTRYFFGLIERDNSIKSSIFSFGIEYEL